MMPNLRHTFLKVRGAKCKFLAASSRFNPNRPRRRSNSTSRWLLPWCCSGRPIGSEVEEGATMPPSSCIDPRGTAAAIMGPCCRGCSSALSVEPPCCSSHVPTSLSLLGSSGMLAIACCMPRAGPCRRRCCCPCRGRLLVNPPRRLASGLACWGGTAARGRMRVRGRPRSNQRVQHVGTFFSAREPDGCPALQVASGEGPDGDVGCGLTVHAWPCSRSRYLGSPVTVPKCAQPTRSGLLLLVELGVLRP